MIVVLLVVAGCRTAPAPVDASGTVDLTTLGDVEAVVLASGWQAQRGVATELPVWPEGLLSDGTRPDASWRPVAMPATFRAQGFDVAPGAPGDGVWYRLRMRLRPGHGMRVAVHPVHVAWRLYAVQPSGAAALLGEVDADGPSLTDVVPVDLPDAEEVTLLWHLASDGARLAGPTTALTAGTSQAILRGETQRKAAHALLIGSLVMLMAGALVVWRRRPDDLRPFALAVLTGVLALRMAAQSHLLDLWGPGLVSARGLFDVLTLGLLTAALGLVVWSFFPVECAAWGRRGGTILLPPLVPNEPTARQRAPRWMRHAFTGSVVAAWVLGLGVAIGAITTTSPDTSPLLALGLRALVVPLVGCLGIVVSAAAFGRSGARVVVAGMALAVAGMVYDIGHVTDALGSIERPLAVYAGFVLTLLIALAFTDVFARAAREGFDLTRLLSDRVATRSRELEDASVAAQAASQAKTQFVSAISHELRTPLAAMIGYASLLEDELADMLTPDQAEFFGVIRTSGDRLDGLVRDLLDLTLIETGRFEVRLSRVPLRPVVDEVVAQLRPAVQDKRLHLSVGDVPDVAVHADAQRLRQVLINLLTNAIKFTDDGVVALSADRTTLDGASAVALAVSDTGQGIDDDFRPRLFERFTQATSAYDATQKGVGLGLAIVKELVTRMHGTIDVESEKGRGSTFTVTLPLAAAGDGAGDGDSVEAASPPSAS